MSEFLLSLIGWDRLVTNLQVPSGFGITPMRDICKVKIGILVNGPKFLPIETSLFNLPEFQLEIMWQKLGFWT